MLKGTDLCGRHLSADIRCRVAGFLPGRPLQYNALPVRFPIGMILHIMIFGCALVMVYTSVMRHGKKYASKQQGCVGWKEFYTPKSAILAKL